MLVVAEHVLSGDGARRLILAAGCTARRDVDCVRTRIQKAGIQGCEDGAPEVGFEKIALYAEADDTPTHAARQLEDGRWASKCGQFQDIVHELPDSICGHHSYGEIAMFMRRKTADRPHPRALNG